MNVTSSLSLANESDSEETTNSSSTGTTTKSSESSLDTDPLTLTTISVQWIIFLIGSIGNITVLVVLLWRRSRSQVGTQLFVGSLAVSDIAILFSSVWVEAYGELIDNWHFGLIPCKLQMMWQFMSMNSSILTLAALSVDRYFASLN